MSNCITIGSPPACNQGDSGIAIGTCTGSVNQGACSIAVGANAAQCLQGSTAIAIGTLAGNSTQGTLSIAIGSCAGRSGQATGAISIGAGAGCSGQQTSGVAIGTFAGSLNQASASVAIGYCAGYCCQGLSAVAIGYNAGTIGQKPYSIIINATSSALNSACSGALYINPVRCSVTNANTCYTLYYDTVQKEVTYAPSGSGMSATGVTSLTAGSGISLSARTGAVTISATGGAVGGFFGIIAGTGTHISSSSGVYTVWVDTSTSGGSSSSTFSTSTLVAHAVLADSANFAAIANTATTIVGGYVSSINIGTGIGVNKNNGNVVLTNTGVLSISAGSGIQLSASTGNIIIASSGGFNTSTLVAYAVLADTATNFNTSTLVAHAVLADTATNFNTSTLVAHAVLADSALSVGRANTASNLAGGSLGSIPVQAGAGTTYYIPIGLPGTVLQSNGTSATWVSTSSLGIIGGGGGGTFSTSTLVAHAVLADSANFATSAAIANTATNLSSGYVSSIIAGSGVSINAATGAVTISSTGGSSSSGQSLRILTTATTASIPSGTTATVNITGYTSWMLYYVTVSKPAWVRIYANSASLTADAGRAQGTDPSVNSGVIAEFITTASNQTILVSPGILGYNLEASPTTNIPIAITNNSGATQAISVILELEQTGGGSISQGAITSLIAGTGTFINTSTGAVTIWTTPSSTSTLVAHAVLADNVTNFNTSTLMAHAVLADNVTNFNTSTLMAHAVLADNVTGGYVASIIAGTGTYISTASGNITIWIGTGTTGGGGGTFSTSTLVAHSVLADSATVAGGIAGGYVSGIFAGTGTIINTSTGFVTIQQNPLLTLPQLTIGSGAPTYTYTPASIVGEITFTSSGTFTVPTGVNSVSIVAAGAGGGGGGSNTLSYTVTAPYAKIGKSQGGGGGGGALAYINNYSVIPGQTLTINVGLGGNGGSSGVVTGPSFAPTAASRGNGGGETSVYDGGSKILGAGGGGGGDLLYIYYAAPSEVAGTPSNTGAGGAGGTVTVGTGYSGGQGGPAGGTYLNLGSLFPSTGGTYNMGGGGGGGAGGYTAAGGQGGSGSIYNYASYFASAPYSSTVYQPTPAITTGSNSTSGGGGGGGSVGTISSTPSAGNGGGAYLDGSGLSSFYQGGPGDVWVAPSGSAGNKTSNVGNGTDGSNDAVGGNGAFGGGGGSNGQRGADGAVRIIWGVNRVFPNTNASFQSGSGTINVSSSGTGNLSISGNIVAGGTIAGLGDLYLTGNIHAANFTSTQVTNIIAGTGTFINTSTGAVTIWNAPFSTSTLVAHAVLADSATNFNTSTLVAHAVLADNVNNFNTGTLMAHAVLADNVSGGYVSSIIAGSGVSINAATGAVTISSTGGGAGGQSLRILTTATTASIPSGTTATVNITGYTSWMLYYVTVSKPAWVRIYANVASASADAYRAQGTDPSVNSGVIAEFITTASNQTILVSPGILGYNLENPVTTNIPIAITNNSGATQAISVILELEQTGGGIITYTTSSSSIFNGGTVSGATTFTNQVTLLGSLTNNSLSTIMNNVGENVGIGSASNGTINLYVLTQSITYYTSAATGNFTLNIAGSGSITLNSIMSIGESVSIVYMNTNGATPYYMNAFQIDGASVTPKWPSGTAPISGNANAIDVYTFSIIKTASATYTVLGSQTKYA